MIREKIKRYRESAGGFLKSSGNRVTTLEGGQECSFHVQSRLRLKTEKESNPPLQSGLEREQASRWSRWSPGAMTGDGGMLRSNSFSYTVLMQAIK